MVKRREAFAQLSESYLFPEIERKKQLFLEKNPQVMVTSLGVGDTVKPIPLPIARSMEKAVARLKTQAGYRGYGDGQGLFELRKKLVSRFYSDRFGVDELFISDGAKCDIGRLQMLFGRQSRVAIQDPVYPVYLEGSLLQEVRAVTLMPCLPENNFYPDLSRLGDLDLIYICHPNNPTGHTYDTDQLKTLVDYAIAHRLIILFDVAYASFIRDPLTLKTIYDVPGAEKVAIEIGSFSKMAGFSGVRLGWTVVPKAIEFEGGQSVWKDWMRMHSAIYNGASSIAQHGGIAVLEEEGWSATASIRDQYLENADRLRKGFEGEGLTVYGGKNIPYLWVHYPHKKSWDVFREFLEQKHLIVTPGRGFGCSGEHFIRVSAFAHREGVDRALRALQVATC